MLENGSARVSSSLDCSISEKRLAMRGYAIY